MKRDASPDSRDSGAALLLALVVVTGVVVAITAALAFASTSVRSSSEAYRPARARLYAADAAAKIAARYLVDHPELGTWNGGQCRALDLGTLGSEAMSASVCAQVATSFELVREAQTDWAVITLPQAGDQDGIRLNSSATVGFTGTVSSTGRINAGGSGTIAITGGSALSSEACRGTVTIDGTTIDNATCIGTPLADPGYAIADPNVPADGSGTCNSSDKIATLQPGTWTKSSWEAVVHDCDMVLMSPGIYHLKDVEWSIDKKVIAGSPAQTPVTAALFSESILGCDPAAQGVQIVLSGITTISLANGGSLHLCGRAKDSDGNGTPDAGAPQIALYGPTADQTGTTATLTPSGASGTITGSGAGSWTTATNGRIVDAAGADATARYGDTSHLAQATLPAKTTGPSGSNGVAALTLTGFGTSGTTYPTTGATIAVTSGVSVTTNVTISATVTSTAGGSCSASNLRPAAATSLETVSASLTCSGTLTGPLTAVVTATNTNPSTTRTWRVDGVTLQFSSPGITKHTPASNKNTLDQGGSGRHFWFTDIVYVPLGIASLQTPNTATYTSFDGLVVRTLAVNGTGGTNQKPVVGDPGYRRDGDVVVTVSVAGTPWVSGRWTYETGDSRTLPPVPTNQTWVVHR